MQMVAMAPPAHWCERFQCDSDTFLEAVLATDYATDLVLALSQASVRHAGPRVDRDSEHGAAPMVWAVGARLFGLTDASDAHIRSAGGRAGYHHAKAVRRSTPINSSCWRACGWLPMLNGARKRPRQWRSSERIQPDRNQYSYPRQLLERWGLRAKAETAQREILRLIERAGEQSPWENLSVNTEPPRVSSGHETGTSDVKPTESNAIQRRPAEQEFASELAALAKTRASAHRLETLALGGGHLSHGRQGGSGTDHPKYVGQRRLMEIAVATFATDRALLLFGLPGTAKSWVSEHLAAAISGDSTLLVQGTAGTAEESIRYSWNYALLLAKGPSRAALVPSPMMRAMESGALGRLEELTRVPADVQDTLISVLSEKTLPIPELAQEMRAARGFNLIATANNKDRGVNEMSSALKRRFNTVILPTPDSLDEEVSIVQMRVESIGRALECRPKRRRSLRSAASSPSSANCAKARPRMARRRSSRRAAPCRRPRRSAWSPTAWRSPDTSATVV